MDEKTRTAVALKRFSLISPIINGQVTSIREYGAGTMKEPIEMPHYGVRRYSPKTINAWYSDYIKGGIDALKPSARSDRGVSRALSPEMTESILKKLREHPKAPATVIYDMLIGERAFLMKDASIATVRRFIKVNRDASGDDGNRPQMLRFSNEQVNQLWQTDIMYGPYVGEKKKKPTYLLAYIDDSSRLITHGQFYCTQDIASLRNSFKEAVLRRGLPKIIYTDNGKIYKCRSFEYLCANLGVTLLHHAPGAAHQKGKIERFFRTVRLRFMSVLKDADLTDIDSLNEKFGTWLLNDYQRRAHEGLSGETPFDFFQKQAGRVELITDLGEFNKKLLLATKRTVMKDATIRFDGELYETDTFLAGEKLDVRYDPDVESGITELYLYRGDVPAGTARLVNYADNAKRRRAGGVRTDAKRPDSTKGNESEMNADIRQKVNAIIYSDVMTGGDAPCSRNSSA